MVTKRGSSKGCNNEIEISSYKQIATRSKSSHKEDRDYFGTCGVTGKK